METKNRIIDTLGEPELLLPASINDGLAANDRAKYWLSLLQMAKAHADHPHAGFSDLRREREAAGVAEPHFDHLIEEAERVKGGAYRIPGARAIGGSVIENLRSMLSPIELAAKLKDEGAAAVAEAGAKRLAALEPALGEGTDDVVDGAAIDTATSGDRARGDSLHLLVMDLHKELNRLQLTVAGETIDGAHAYALAGRDRSLVRAFMRGVNATSPLRFDHPGLGTTATRSGERLVIQNDIGQTDAHVVVVHIEGRRATLTYSDVHLERLLFFQGLFERFGVEWDDTLSRRDADLNQGDVYHLCSGAYQAPTREALEEYLRVLGSRLVFLIDWNRARKRLRNFLPKRDVLGALRWAAQHDHGHMAWLRMGGELLVFDAMEFAIKGPFRFGEQLHQMLGAERALGYLKFVLRTCAEGLLAGRPESLIRDEVRAELINYFRTVQQDLFEVAEQHACLIVEIACGVRDGLLKAPFAASGKILERGAERAREWEHRADALVNQARAMVRRSEASAFFRTLLEAADDVADSLEETAFHLTLLQGRHNKSDLHAPLLALSNLLVQGAQEFVKAVATAGHVHRGGEREDTQDFLAAVHRIMVIEQRSDDAQRAVKTGLMQSAADFRQLYVFAEAARSLEEAADALMHAALLLRDYVLGEAMVK